MVLTHNEYALIARLAKRLAVRERKIARERDAQKIQLDLEGFNFVKFINFIHFEHAPTQ